MSRALASSAKLYLLNTGQIRPTSADYLLQLKIIYFSETGHVGCSQSGLVTGCPGLSAVLASGAASTPASTKDSTDKVHL